MKVKGAKTKRADTGESDHRKTILMVDDEADIISIYATLLQDDGYDVHVANNGADGLRLATELQPSLTILDVYMPGANGLEVLRQLKERKVRTRVIMATGNADVSDVVLFIRAGACDYIVKPFSLEKLTNAIKRAMFLEPSLDLDYPDTEKIANRLFALQGAEERVEKKLATLRKMEDRQLFYRMAARAISLLVAVGVTLTLHWAGVLGSTASLACAPILLLLLLLPLERIRKFRIKTSQGEGELEV